MTASVRYIMLMASLPPLGNLFGQYQTPLTEMQLRHRLRFLADDDNKTLRRIEQLVRRSKQPPEWTDAKIVESAQALVVELRSNTLKEAVEFVLNLRTIVAALRRRKLGENSPPRSVWGYSPWIKRIERHWTEPDFGLGTVLPWVSKARRLWENNDSVELERVILTESWKQFSRLSNGHYFDFAAVVLYVLRWSLINRRVNYSKEIAEKRFNLLINDGIGNFDQICASKTT
ncbi:MAG TPA: DUF2764 family protein [Chthoniobacterales bacterium]|nr:DUF2764 family protein [Chthoniobacterales bacterium]